MKNNPVSEQLELQEQDVRYSERKIEIDQDGNQKNKNSNNLVISADIHTVTKQGNKSPILLPFKQINSQASDSLNLLTPLEGNFQPELEARLLKPKKRKKKERKR